MSGRRNQRRQGRDQDKHFNRGNVQSSRAWLGYVQGSRVAFYRLPTRKHTANSKFDLSNIDKLPDVEIVYGYENVSRTAIDALSAAHVDGIVYAGVGDGNPSETTEKALADARQNGVLIVRSARVGNGIVARNNEVNDDQRDFVVSDTLNRKRPEFF